MATPDYKLLLLQAMRAKHGVVVHTNNPRTVKAQLGLARKNLGLVDKLSIFHSRTRPNDEVVIVKKASTDAEEA